MDPQFNRLQRLTPPSVCSIYQHLHIYRVLRLKSSDCELASSLLTVRCAHTPSNFLNQNKPETGLENYGYMAAINLYVHSGGGEVGDFFVLHLTSQ